MKAAEARRLFDAHAQTYDRVNSIISLGLDARWRDWAARQAVTHPGGRILDAFAGTGRVGLRAAELGGRVTLADVSQEMLAVACRDASGRDLDVQSVVTDLASGDPCGSDERFDAVTIMWGLRYLDDPTGTLRSLAACIGPGGRLVIVDFVEPAHGVVVRAASWYFFRALPWIAGTLAGRRDLYRELIATTRAMGSRERVVSMIRDAGLDVIQERMMGFGLVLGVVAVPRSARE